MSTENPTSSSPRADAKVATRKALLAAGRAAISEEGLDAPSLDAICARAGKTRGAFYVHFDDREDFVVAVMEQSLREFLDAIVVSGEGAEDLAQTVQRFTASLLEGRRPILGGDAPWLHHIFDACARYRELNDRFVKMLQEAMARLSRGVEQAQAAGVLRADLPAAALGQMLVGLAIGQMVMFEIEVPVEFTDATTALLQALAR